MGRNSREARSVPSVRSDQWIVYFVNLNLITLTTPMSHFSPACFNISFQTFASTALPINKILNDEKFSSIWSFEHRHGLPLYQRITNPSFWNVLCYPNDMNEPAYPVDVHMLNNIEQEKSGNYTSHTRAM